MKYPLAESTWDREEIEIINRVCRSSKITMGKNVGRFEKLFSKKFRSKYAVMVNSGSSANLLSVASMIYHSKKFIKKGDEVIVPAVSWSTTYFPLFQCGIKIRIVDIDPETLNINTKILEDAITSKTKGILAVNILGCPNDYNKIESICKKNNLFLIEDNCESMGAKYGDKYCGTFGICGTFSMYYSHHICTIEGGVVITNDEELYQILLSMRAHGWTRQLPKNNLISEKWNDDFRDAYHFVLPGYNLRPHEISGAVGICQLGKLDQFIKMRKNNAEYFRKIFSRKKYISIQKTIGQPSWFAFSMIMKDRMVGHRDKLVKYLSNKGIECRPIVAGNFIKNPVMKYIPHTVYEKLKVAEWLDKEGFYIGNYHYDLSKKIEYVEELIEKYVNKRT